MPQVHISSKSRVGQAFWVRKLNEILFDLKPVFATIGTVSIDTIKLDKTRPKALYCKGFARNSKAPANHNQGLSDARGEQLMKFCDVSEKGSYAIIHQQSTTTYTSSYNRELVFRCEDSIRTSKDDVSTGQKLNQPYSNTKGVTC